MLQSVLVQVSAKECLFSADIDESEKSKLQKVLQRCQVVSTDRNRGEALQYDVRH